MIAIGFNCWTRDDEIIYSTLSGLWIVRPGRDPTPEPLTKPRDGEIEHSDPTILPDLEHVLFTVSTGTEAHIAMVSLKTKDWDVVVRNAVSARFAKGRLLFAQEGAIRMVPFDPSSTDAPGVSQPLQDGVYTTPGSGGGRVITHYDVTSDGTLAYAPATARPTWSWAYWVGRDGEGKGKEICSGFGDWKHPRLSPNEDGFAIDILDKSGVKNVHVYSFRRKARASFTQDGMSLMSAYTRSGSMIARSTHRKRLLREFSNPWRISRRLTKTPRPTTSSPEPTVRTSQFRPAGK